MKILITLSISFSLLLIPSLAQAETAEEYSPSLEEIMQGLPDQIMAVLLVYLTFKTFLDMIK